MQYHEAQLKLFHKSTMQYLEDILKITYDAPPSSLMDLTMSPKLKTVEREGVRVHSLVRSTLGVEGHAGTLGWDEED
jgi:hypothetical protein